MIVKYRLSYLFFALDTIKGITTAHALDILRLNTLRGNKPPCRYEDYPIRDFLPVLQGLSQLPSRLLVWV